MLWLLASLIGGCVIDGTRYEGEVSNHCLSGGSYYTDSLCGPRGPSIDALSDAQWAAAYTGHRDYDPKHLQSLASKFEQLAEDLGGEGASAVGTTASTIARAWFSRDLSLGVDQSARFVRQMCRSMRASVPIDEGPDYASLFSEGSLGYLSTMGAYQFCKRAKGLSTCRIESGKWMVDTAYEVGICAKSQPACLRGREVCLGTCSGTESGSYLRQDTLVTLSKQEMGSLPAAKMEAGRVNTSLRSIEIHVPLFDTGSAFQLYVARLRVRGGFSGNAQLFLKPLTDCEFFDYYLITLHNGSHRPQVLRQQPYSLRRCRSCFRKGANAYVRCGCRLPTPLRFHTPLSSSSSHSPSCPSQLRRRQSAATAPASASPAALARWV